MKDYKNDCFELGILQNKNENMLYSHSANHNSRLLIKINLKHCEYKFKN